MANRRMLDSAFWEDRAVQAKLSRTARYLFIGLISHADDEGRAIADPVWLKSRIFLYDDDVAVSDVRACLDEIAAACRSVCLYEHEGELYVAFLKWEQYQSIKNSRGSSLPAPPANPLPTVGKPGPKRKLAPEADKEQLPSNSTPDLSDGIGDELQSNSNRIDEELALREENRREVNTHTARAREQTSGANALRPQPVASPPESPPNGDRSPGALLSFPAPPPPAVAELPQPEFPTLAAAVAWVSYKRAADDLISTLYQKIAIALPDLEQIEATPAEVVETGLWALDVKWRRRKHVTDPEPKQLAELVLQRRGWTESANRPKRPRARAAPPPSAPTGPALEGAYKRRGHNPFAVKERTP